MSRTPNAPTTATASFVAGFAATQRGGNESAIVLDAGTFSFRKPLERNLINDMERHYSNDTTNTPLAITIIERIERTSASVSIIASVLLIVYILRSHQGLSTTYHRLMFIMCISDIVYTSVLYQLGSFMVPKEMKDVIPGAHGNVNTCTAQGFLSFVSLNTSTYYNCSMCFYYLAIIKYNKSDAYITTKLERWFHGIPITVALLFGFLFLAVEGYNTSVTACYVVAHEPQHCEGYPDRNTVEGFSIPCGRGNAFYSSSMFPISIAALASPPPIIMVTTMVMMYRTVIEIERKAARYGVNALRLLRTTNQQDKMERGEHTTLNLSEDAPPSTPSIIEKIHNCVSCWLCSLWHFLGMAPSPARRSNALKRAASRKRAILQMASGYVVAWALVWVPGLINYFTTSFEAMIIVSLLAPLQGFFNFIVFMSPKVRAAKKPTRRRGQQQEEEGKLSWYKAITKAYMSRGVRIKTAHQ